MDKNRDQKESSQEEEREKQLEHRLRTRFEWEGLIEDLIQDGQERGLFDNLKGKGKPLALSKNIYEGDQSLANTFLKDNNLRPTWISSRDTILSQIEALRSNIAQTWQRHERAFDVTQDETRRGALMISWDDACQRWEHQILKLNKQIGDFNLRRPSDNLEIFKLRFEEELKRANAPRWLR